MKEINNIVIYVLPNAVLVIRIKKDLAWSLKAQKVSVILVKEKWVKSKSKAIQSPDWA